MSIVKQIEVKVIPKKMADYFIRKFHYSGKSISYSRVNFGAFHGGILHGVVQFGSSVNKRALQKLVKGTKWSEFLEINRIAFDDKLPKNSESRCLGICLRILRKKAPHLKWIIAYVDGTQCGDGTIYRASGFLLTKINPCTETHVLPNGEHVQGFGLRTSGYLSWLKPYITKKKFFELTKGGRRSKVVLDYIGAVKIRGFMLRYIYFFNKEEEKSLVPDIIPYSRIKEVGASMYKGQKMGGSSDQVDTPGDLPGKGGSTPTLPLQTK